MNNTTLQSRPYRSHRVPACDRCRRRKIRCNITATGQPCELCAEKGLSCLFTGTRTSNARPPAAHPGRPSPARAGRRSRLENARPSSVSRARASDSAVSEGSPTAPRHLRDTSAPSTRNGDRAVSGPAGEASIVIGPLVAEDVQILQRYLTAEPRTGLHSSQPYSVVSNAPGDPMIYLALPRHREGLKLAKDSGRSQREILDQILGPKKQEVVQLYFTHIHPAFPVLDEELVSGLDGPTLSSTLLCEIYAISLTFWNFSDTLKHHHCPSEQYFWNHAIAALQEDFLAPNLYTLYSSMVDLLGRPVGSIQGNIMNSGRTTALAHSLGLNRDPSEWRTATREKKMRIRIFWGCMVLDQWSSFAHGVPPSILRRQYDVPLPTLSMLLTPGNETIERVQAAECFIQLCRLSQILGDVLPLVYDLSEPDKEIWRKLRRLECDLDEWEQKLPEFLQVGAVENATSVSGASSLHFGYLSVRMLTCRLSYRVAAREKGSDAPDVRQYHFTTLRRAATRIADFVCLLKSSHLREFWLSFTGHLLVSAATVLLRCAIDTANATVAEECRNTLKTLRRRLHLAKSKDNWDLADMFIKRCDEPISRIIAPLDFPMRDREVGTVHATQATEENQQLGTQEETPDLGTSGYPELNIPIGPLDSDCPWESLWDILES
ncbi:c6 transcription factor [Diplodia corticola]|uniref:C6 transcription factor n=1 Tax=Diplodia corticola TaxID=236234 RepID=A0A1J9S7J8_9PEZI|nr:c6 transcription factor [Diplodia corticola]OJD35573.1 c6 transcription factor [Diplodia corticola]